MSLALAVHTEHETVKRANRSKVAHAPDATRVQAIHELSKACITNKTGASFQAKLVGYCTKYQQAKFPIERKLLVEANNSYGTQFNLPELQT
jgi:hypothetical protein